MMALKIFFERYIEHIFIDKRKVMSIALEISSIALLFFFVHILNKANYVSTNWGRKPDIHYEYTAAVDISKGENPYNKILEGDIINNNKYATLFPLYYYFLLVIAFFSKFSFIDFYHNYRKVLFLFQFVAFLFVYLKFRESDKKLLGFTAASFLILNRWAISSVSTSKQDLISIGILLASFYFLKKKPRLSYLLYGLSLGIKHIGIFFLPIYLLPLITKERKLKDFAIDIVVFLSPLIVTSMPFIFENIRSFFLSIMFSFTRVPETDTTGTLYGYQKLLQLYNPGTKEGVSTFTLLLPRLPLILFSILNTVLLFTKRIGVFSYGLFAIMIFIAFNPVYFDQYMLWMCPFVSYFYFDTVSVNKNTKSKVKPEVS